MRERLNGLGRAREAEAEAEASAVAIVGLVISATGENSLGCCRTRTSRSGQGRVCLS